MVMPGRLQERLDAAGLSQNELAKRVGVATQTIWKLVNGHSQSSAHLHKIARELQTTAEYLDGDSDNPDVPSGSYVALQSANDDEVEIDSIDLSYGLGGTFLDTEDIEIEKAKFSRGWLRQFTDSPPNLLFSTQGAGDSMWPTIHDRDVVIVDRSQKVVDQGDKMWAIVFGGVGMIKRLRPMPDGTVKILSDNQSIPPEVATDGDLFIVGRIAAIVRRV